MKSFVVFCLMAILIVVGCEKKVEPVPVGEMNEYKDPAYGFRVKYPKEWKQLGTAGKAVFVKTQEVLDKFLDPRTGIEGGAALIEVMPYSGKPAAEFIQTAKEELKANNAEITPDEQLTVAGKPSTKVTYRIQATTKTSMYGYMIFVQGDTAIYKIEFKGYGEQYQAHAAVFEAMLKTFELPVIVAKKSDIWQASGNLETYTSNFFTMQYPDNLNIVDVKKGDKDFVMEMRADRLDCSIHIDVFGAKNLSIEKVWEQNKGKYKARGTGESTVDGQKAYWVDYSLVKDISSRAYFVVKNDKVIRATLNWFAPQKEAYFPAFENCVKTIKLK